MSAHPAIAPLAIVPLFLKLCGRRAVVIGSSEGARWKAALLAAAGSDVVRLGDGWSPSDLRGAAIVVADLGDEEEARRLFDAAHAAGALLNLIDAPELSDVQFGTIVNRSPIVIGISTDGAAPMLGQGIRARIEAVLPLGLAAWGRAAKAWRPRLRARLRDFSARRAFWQRFVAAALSGAPREPEEADFLSLIEPGFSPKGQVILVGAGPGDPSLLTLKAVQALQSATVVLHDRLIGPQILELARREARRVPVGKTGHGPSCSQSEINELMVGFALAGETVVRLKGGDPLIFGRAAEEIEACRKAGVEIAVVPGISAAQGAAASLLVSLTERRHARRVQFLTGHGADGNLPADIDWASVADAKVTTILYMPRATLDAFVLKALRKGLDPSTPAVAIASATLPQETHVAGSVAEIGELAATLPAGAPVLLMIGWVCRAHVCANEALRFSQAIAS